MAPRKLSDADKRDVIDIYRQPGETTSTIAKRYGVSTSTISRILKTQLPEDEYRALISQKRSATSDKPPVPVPKRVEQKRVEQKSTPEKPVRRARKRSSAADTNSAADDADQLELLAAAGNAAALENSDSTSSAENSDDKDNDVSAVATELLEHPRLRRKKNIDDDLEDQDLDDIDDDLEDQDLDDIDDDLDSELDAEFDDDDDDDDGEDDDSEEDGEPGLLGLAVEIMPISDAVFPRTCYLVVDRLSELITHPLNEFADLGKIPAEQASALTLPVFDNHRVARRFSRRNQRVIKVPDGQLITKTTPYLQAKGISHLLIDGNIYSLLG